MSSILILEDCQEDFDTALEALHGIDLPCQVCRAITGDECLSLLVDAKTIRPDLVLLDLNTPGIDGREVLRTIKTAQGLKSIPVVVLTTSSNPNDLAACYEFGANAYHLKPVQYPNYLEILELIFKYWLKYVILLSKRS